MVNLQTLLYSLLLQREQNDTHLAALAGCHHLIQDGFRSFVMVTSDEVIAAFNAGEEEAQAGKQESTSC